MRWIIWRARASLYMSRWPTWTLRDAWHHCGSLRDYLDDGFSPRDACDEDRSYWD
ncbi:hypothetical protein [Xanthobacter wiegelii]|uniref:hypothetical protein n=1 Tax=Xanthobacter wiegelii TaxID=3119913 RepID=UPI00372CE647